MKRRNLYGIVDTGELFVLILLKLHYNDNLCSILSRADMLPAFVMSVRWQVTERVQELYDLLDLWKQPTPIEALMLLDRKFMDPKVLIDSRHDSVNTNRSYRSEPSQRIVWKN